MTGSVTLTLFLGGDIMTGRGIDQILPHPSHPKLYEPSIKDARSYVELAESANGRIMRPVGYSYVWGEALDELQRKAPHLRIVNLETAITTNNAAWPGKDVHYRMHPLNSDCLKAAKIDCCALANNHILDWDYSGLEETLAALRLAGISTAGAGSNSAEASEPAVLPLPDARVIVFAWGSTTSGIPKAWAASPVSAGVNMLEPLSPNLGDLKHRVQTLKREGDVLVASIHWGSNWGYSIPAEQIELAHFFIQIGFDVVHGHSSHHVKGIEVYKGHPILYGCGDLLTDYEGIGGHEGFRPDLALMYFLELSAASGTLKRLIMTPIQMRKFRAVRISEKDALWLKSRLCLEGKPFGTSAELLRNGDLELRWQ